MFTSSLNETLLRQLRSIVGEAHVSQKLPDRLSYARDQWPRSLLRHRQGEHELLPQAVVWPGTAQEVAQILACCREHQTSLVPTGSGSAVTGAVVATRSGVAMDMKRLNRLVSLNTVSGIAEIEGGILGVHLEEQLQSLGWTLGHFPSSILCSTLGGWIATRSAGQASSSYGKIEDMVVDLELAMTDGSVQWLQADDGLVQLVTGSEGIFGCITAARVRIHPAPVAMRFRGVLFPDVDSGLKAMQRLLQDKRRPPAILRLYDTLDSWISSHTRSKLTIPEENQNISPLSSLPVPKQRRESQTTSSNLPARVNPVQQWMSGWKEKVTSQFSTVLKHGSTLSQWADKLLPSQALLILGVESFAEDDAHMQIEDMVELCKDGEGKDLGAGPGWHWFRHRYDVSYKQAPVFHSGAFSDTLEVAASWSILPLLYSEVRKALQSEAFVMAHFSHAYPDGCSIYFTFATSADEGENELVKYDRLWGKALEAAYRAGGTISHHHSVGLGKARLVPNELGEGGMKLLAAAQKAFSPEGTMNPGKFSLKGHLHG